MTEDKPKRLNEVIASFAPQGANDNRWFFIGHQLEQVVVSARSVVCSLETVKAGPENAEERELARDCLQFMRAMLCDILAARASLQSYLSGTDVPDRISRKEL